jgi:hypothetical protein
VPPLVAAALGVGGSSVLCRAIDGRCIAAAPVSLLCRLLQCSVCLQCSGQFRCLHLIGESPKVHHVSQQVQHKTQT